MRNIGSARALACAASIAAAGWLAVSPAAAQIYAAPAPYPAPYYSVGPAQVIARIESMGLRPVDEPRLRGPVWTVRAVGRDGTLVRVLIDAGSGGVVNMVVLARPYPPQVPARGPINEGPWVPMGPGDDDLPPPPPGYGPPAGYAPPPGYPGSQSSVPAQSAKKVASHPSTPLPKPRPAAAAQDASKGQAPAIAAAPKEPETTGSLPARKVEGLDAKKSQEPPVNPLE